MSAQALCGCRHRCHTREDQSSRPFSNERRWSLDDNAFSTFSMNMSRVLVIRALRTCDSFVHTATSYPFYTPSHRCTTCAARFLPCTVLLVLQRRISLSDSIPSESVMADTDVLCTAHFDLASCMLAHLTLLGYHCAQIVARDNDARSLVQ